MIYLDIDGVILLPGDTSQSPDAQQRAMLVRSLAILSDSRIVICSHRRRSDDVKTLLADLGLADLLLQGKWKTPVLDDDDLDPGLPVRGQEIAAHMSDFPQGRHVILDDDFCLPGQNHVQINANVGLTRADAQKAHDILKDQVA